MDANEGFTRLFFEKNIDQTLSGRQLHYVTKKITLKKNDIKIIKQFERKYKIRFERLVYAAWGLVLNHFSATENLTYGLAELQAIKKNQLVLSAPISLIHCNMDEHQTIKSLINKCKPSKTTIRDENSAQIRYLLLLKTTKKIAKKKSMLIDPHVFPLALMMDKKKYRLDIIYQTGFFDETNINNFIAHFYLVLMQLLNLSTKVIDINFLIDKEKTILLTKWNKPKYPFNTPLLKQCIHDLVSHIAKKLPNKLAINHNENNVTFQTLDESATLFAKQLIAKGIEPLDHVAVMMERTPTLLMVMLAVFKCGAVYVPINTKYPEERIEFVLNDSQSKLIIVNDIEKLSEKNKEKAIAIHHDWNALTLNNISQHIQLPFVSTSQLAYIIYTSGTTGQPKGVMIKHESLNNIISWYQSCFKITSDDCASQFASAAFDTFLCETVPFLAIGASVHIVDDTIKLTPDLFFSWLQQQKITVCDLPTAYAKVLFTKKWPDDLALRLLKIGGESIPHYPAHAFTFDIWNSYGPTETTIEATYIKIYTANTQIKKNKMQSTPPIGKPIANSEIYVLNHFLKPAAMGVPGELFIGGIGVSSGYLNRPELNKERFITLPWLNDNQKFYRTGDLVRFTHQGNLDFIGRIDHQVKIRGYRIELGDIENAISQYSDVNEVTVLTKENINGEKTLIAYVVPNLNKERYLYQERCLLSLSDYQLIEIITEDISKDGIAISGVNETLTPGQQVKLHLKLPGFTDGKQFNGHVIWQQDTRAGIRFDLSQEEKTMVEKSIDYYLSTHNVMELVLSSSAKRSLRKALRHKLPDYMVPATFVTLLQFPLTFSGKIDTKALPPPQAFENILRKENISAKTTTEKKLEKIWCELLHKNTISMSDNFFDLGGSSITAAELSVRILTQFKKSIPTKILFDLPYIPILAEYIDTNGAKYHTQSVIQEEIEQDSILPEDIVPAKKQSPSPKEPQHILLTGAGGFLGVYLLRELLAQTDAKIYCLIRKGEFETAAKRLMATLKNFDLDKEITLADRRIIAIASDISFDHFGLPREQYNSLVEKVDLIYHCGAQVNIMASYNKLRGSNVQGTLEVIKFASSHVVKPIHYISTLSSACNYDEAGTLAEVFPDENYHELFGGYAISKWVSERLLTQLKTRGVPATIYRSGYIAGQSDTGMTNMNDALFMLIKGCIQMGYAPEMEEKITILPVDFVSRSIVQISLLYPRKSEVYHIDHPTGILWADLIAWLNDYGYRIKMIPMQKWQNLLLTITPNNALYPFLPYYLSLPENFKTPNVNVSHTTKVLKKLHVSYPVINESLLTKYFDFLCQMHFIPIPLNVEAT